LRILDAATISMALVILRVFCTLLILVRISLPLAWFLRQRAYSPGLLELGTAAALSTAFSASLVQILGGLDLVHQVRVSSAAWY
jgi:hypothetical protein